MAEAGRGRLKLYLGYAAGVGKTYQMLEEGQALKSQGVDAVIGYFESHGRKDTIAKTEGLETIPRLKIEYRGSIFEEMNTDAILARHPRYVWSMNLPTAIFRGPRARNGGKMWKCCGMPGSIF
jgi:K+-sensing histidine kinase KdpD